MMPTFVALKPAQAVLLSEFTASKESSKYTPQSLTIQGMLADMYENFARAVQEATNTEATRNRNYEEFMEEKAKELAALEAEKADKEEKKAKAEEDLADATQEYDDTEAQMKVDIEFFDETKKSCKAKHEEWVERSSLRQEEIEGVQKAIEILSTDEARE